MRFRTRSASRKSRAGARGPAIAACWSTPTMGSSTRGSSPARSRATERLCPLVAVRPVYMHPYAVAKIVASIGHVYGRRVYLNMVAGGFRNDLVSLGDETSHDERYARLTEYTQIVTQLLSGER